MLLAEGFCSLYRCLPQLASFSLTTTYQWLPSQTRPFIIRSRLGPDMPKPPANDDTSTMPRSPGSSALGSITALLRWPPGPTPPCPRSWRLRAWREADKGQRSLGAHGKPCITSA
ncbi:unnamed protein product [Arctogadus glacialis]